MRMFTSAFIPGFSRPDRLSNVTITGNTTSGAGPGGIHQEVAASVPVLIVGSIVPNPSRLYGAQALLLGSIAAFAWSYRGQGRMSFFGVIDMKPVHIIYLVLALSALMFITSGDAVALAADLGAIGGGMGFIEWLRRPPKRRRRPKRRKKQSSFDVVQGGRTDEPRWLN